MLNSKTLTDRYPIPSLQSFTQHIQGSTYFSRVDLRKAYHQVSIHEDDRHKTAIVTSWGLFQYRHLAMGLSNAGQCFQKVIDSVLDSMNNIFCYVDDILVFNSSKKAHLDTLEKLFKHLKEAGL